MSDQPHDSPASRHELVVVRRGQVVPGEGAARRLGQAAGQALQAHELAVTIVILGIALVLRVWTLGAESAWIDEAYSIALARRTVLEIIRGTMADQHPPLYYLLLQKYLKLGSRKMYFANLY